MDDKTKYASIRSDFEARLRFLSAEEGGRQTPWVSQGNYRPDFSYADELDIAFMVWPIFVDERGEPLPEGTKVFTDRPVIARMVIINDELRATEHRRRINAGVKFCVREGQRIVAEGVVTRILALSDD